MKYLRATFTIFSKDLLNEKRTLATMGAMLVFAMIVVLIFLFAFDLTVGLRVEAASGIIWVTLCFSGTLSLDRTLSLEREAESMDGLRLAPFDHTAIYFAKVLVNWFFMLVSAILVILIYSIFGNVSLVSGTFFLVIVLGTLGYILTGTLIGTMNMQIKVRGPMLSVLLFPLLIPLILAVVNASSISLNGGNLKDLGTWLGLLAGYDLLSLAAGIVLYNKTLDE